MHGRRIAASTLWQLASQGTTAVLSILTVKLVAIGLDQTYAGYYQSAYGYLQIFGILADFGLYAVSIREIAKAAERERVLGALLTLRIVILAFAMGSALFLAWIVPQWRGTPLPLGITLAALVPTFTLLSGVLRAIFQVHYRMHWVFCAEVLQRSVTLVLIAALVLGEGVRESADPSVYISILLAGGAGAVILLFVSFLGARRVLRIRPCTDPAILVFVLKRAVPFGVAYLCIALYRQTDMTLIALLRDDFAQENAMYGFALRAAEMGFLIPTFVLNSVLPAWSAADVPAQRKARLAGRTLAMLLATGAVTAIPSIFLARPLMGLLTTSQYLSTAVASGADTALRLFALPMLLNGFVLFGFYALLAVHHWRTLAAILGCGSLLALALNMVLIPLYGFVGAGVTSNVVHVVLTLLILPPAWRALRPGEP